MDVENLAVSVINGMIARCPHLKAYIATNDKTPFTDGYIDRYSGIRQSKEEWLGRVSIQVKGRTVKSKSGISSYPITKTDLRAYQRDSGVLYFVVAIDLDTGLTRPYYALLSPFRIEAILEGASRKHASVSVPLNEFPDDPAAIEGLVALALKTQEQSMSLGFDPVLFEKLASITVHTASAINWDVPVVLAPDAQDFALVLHTIDGLSVPLGGEIHILPHDYMPQIVDLTVRSGDISYDQPTIKRLDEQTIELELSAGLKLTLKSSPEGRSSGVALTLEDTLAGRLKALEFFVSLLDTGVLEMNGERSPFKITGGTEDTQLRLHLQSLRELSELFETLHVDARLVDLATVSDAQATQLSMLHRALVKGEEISDPEREPSRVVQKVGQWHLMLLLTPGSAPGKLRLLDPFSTTFRQQFRWSSSEDGKQDVIPVTAYDIVEEEYFPTILNMRLDAIVGAYEAIGDFASTFNVANQRVLALLLAADASDARRDEFLDAAERLNDWLILEEGDKPHHLINRWQIWSRSRGLSDEDRSAVRALRRRLARGEVENENALELEIACSLLLEDFDEVEDRSGDLDPTDRERMEGWPIWRLYRDRDQRGLAERAQTDETAP